MADDGDGRKSEKMCAGSTAAGNDDPGPAPETEEKKRTARYGSPQPPLVRKLRKGKFWEGVNGEELGRGIGIWAKWANSAVWFAFGISAWKPNQIPSSESSYANSQPNFPSERARKRAKRFARHPPLVSPVGSSASCRSSVACRRSPAGRRRSPSPAAVPPPRGPAARYRVASKLGIPRRRVTRAPHPPPPPRGLQAPSPIPSAKFLRPVSLPTLADNSPLHALAPAATPARAPAASCPSRPPPLRLGPAAPVARDPAARVPAAGRLLRLQAGRAPLRLVHPAPADSLV
nr:actin-binding protein wsp1-like [Lolium perenne]